MSEGDMTAVLKPASRGRRFMRWGSILLIGVFLLIVFMPWIVSNTRVLNYLVFNGFSQSDPRCPTGRNQVPRPEV